MKHSRDDTRAYTAVPVSIDMESLFIRLRRDIEVQIVKIVACRETAADIASDIYIKLKRVTPLCRSEAEAWGYLRKMARSAAIDHVRSTRRRNELLVAFPPDDVRTPTPEALATVRDEAAVAKAALSELPRRTQDMLYMSRMLGMSYSEIAGECGVSRSLVEKVVAEGLLHCRNRLRELAEWETAREVASEEGKPVSERIGRFRALMRARFA